MILSDITCKGMGLRESTDDKRRYSSFFPQNLWTEPNPLDVGFMSPSGKGSNLFSSGFGLAATSVRKFTPARDN